MNYHCRSTSWALYRWKKENIFLSIILVVAGIFWLSKCSSSLTLDETVTYWIVKEGFVDFIYRSLHYQFGPFYYLIVWLFVKVAGNSEIVLRLPSIMAFILLCIVLYRFSTKIFDRESAFFGVVVLLCLKGILAYAVFARPYELALLLSVITTYELNRWTNSNGLRHKLFYILFATLTVYTHYIFAGIFMVHLIYFCYCWKRVNNHAKVTLSGLIGVYLCIAILILPAIYQILIIHEKRYILSFALAPTLLNLFQSWFKPYLFLFLLSSVLAARIVSEKINIERFAIQPELLILLLSWYLLPSLIAFFYSVGSGASVFWPRYYIWSLPALSLLLGKILSLITPPRSKFILVTILSVLMLIYGGIQSPFNEDWSSAITFIRKNNGGSNFPVVTYTGLIESKDTAWVIHPEKRRYLLSPFAAYRLDKEPLLLPLTFDQPGATEHLEKAVFPELKKVNQFYLILRMWYIFVNKSPVTSDQYLINNMELLGFQPEQVEIFGHVKVITFKKI